MESTMRKIKLLHEGFSTLVDKESSKTAIIYKDQIWDYYTLNQHVMGIRKKIRASETKTKLIGILGEKSNLSIASILAILEEGYAYLPIDINYPVERINYIIQNSEVECVLVLDEEQIIHIENNYVKKIFITEHDVVSEKLENAVCSENGLAYIIYTSGSTGKPNGVKILHKNICNTINWRMNYYHMDEAVVSLQYASLSFDSSVEDIFCVLSCGGTLVIPEERKKLDLKYMENLIDKNKVSHMLLVPSVYALFLKRCKYDFHSVKEVVLAGECISEQLKQQHFELNSHIRLFNEYGPTENSVCSTVAELHLEEKVHIGKPIEGVSAYILNDDMEMVGRNEKGILYLSGKGIAQEYVNNKKATDTKFLKWNGKNVYCTGDVVMMNDDGNLVFIGRNDNEIKINGIRVNLDEIAQMVKEKFQVSVCICFSINIKSAKGVCLALLKEDKISLLNLVEDIKKSLPKYMHPNYVYLINEVPRLPNQKVDYEALRMQVLSILDKSLEARKKLLNELQEIIVEYAIDVVEHDTDLLQAGIDSLSLVNFLVDVEDKFGIEMDLMDEDIDNNFTIDYICELIEMERRKNIIKI